MVKTIKTFGFIMVGIAAIVMVGGIMAIWISGVEDGMPVSTDSRAIYSGTNTSSVSLMFNVYSGEQYIPDVLNALKEGNATATFFIGGCWADKNEEVLKAIAQDGHEIGSHGYLHRDHSKLDYDANYKEMSVAHTLLKMILGIDVTLFAPPSGAFSTVTLDAAEAMGYKTVLWTQGKDTVDWRDHDTALIIERATKNIKGGDLILMHPTANTAEALPEIIKQISANGLTLSSVSDTL